MSESRTAKKSPAQLLREQRIVQVASFMREMVSGNSSLDDKLLRGMAMSYCLKTWNVAYLTRLDYVNKAHSIIVEERTKSATA